MADFETFRLSCGSVKRRRAPVVSPTLLALPEAVRPAPILACTTCPAGSWYHDDGEQLACHCAARRYVSWASQQRLLILCDDREAALKEQERPNES